MPARSWNSKECGPGVGGAERMAETKQSSNGMGHEGLARPMARTTVRIPAFALNAGWGRGGGE